MHKRTLAQGVWTTQNPSGKSVAEWFAFAQHPVRVVALAGTLVESLPLKNVGNITVTLAAVALGHWLVK